MNTSSKKIYLSALLITVAFLLLTTGAYTYSILFEYDAQLGHFETSVFSSVFLPLLYILAAVVFIVFGVVFRSALSGREYRMAIPSIFSSGFAALSSAVWLVTLIPYGFQRDAEGKLSLPIIQAAFWLLLIVTACILITHFVFSAIPTPPRTPAVLAATLTMLFPVAYAFFAYFDTAFTLNSPIKLLDQVTMLVLLLFFLIDGRMRFGAASEALFLPIAMLTAALSGASSIGAFIYMAVKGQPLFASVMHDFLFFGFFLLALTRLISFLLPNLVIKPEESTAIPATFETESGGSAILPTAFAQESFDFDATATEENAPASERSSPEEDAPATDLPEEDVEEGSAATIDVDGNEEN